jgi:hypothetical protein
MPTPLGREYFDDLVRRLTEERRLDVHVTYREAFDRMVYFARKGEAALVVPVVPRLPIHKPGGGGMR